MGAVADWVLVALGGVMVIRGLVAWVNTPRLNRRIGRWLDDPARRKTDAAPR